MNRAYFFIIVSLATLIFPLNAFAYLDPATGSIIIQGVLGAIAATAFVVRLYWDKFLTFFGIKKNIDTESELTDEKKDS